MLGVRRLRNAAVGSNDLNNLKTRRSDLVAFERISSPAVSLGKFGSCSAERVSNSSLLAKDDAGITIKPLW